jgi:threonine dehydrogenase-like Zn-dependent dehydrogenase
VRKSRGFEVRTSSINYCHPSHIHHHFRQGSHRSCQSPRYLPFKSNKKEEKMIILVVLLILTYLVTVKSSSNPSKTTLIVLDIDNTLYQEAEAGIEAQIVRNTHSYCQEKLDITSEQADELYKKYGSTVEGLRQTLWIRLDDSELDSRLKAFYEGIYRSIDYSSLLVNHKQNPSSSTGYSHSQQNRDLLCQLLRHSPHSICVASNSPSWHVDKVLQAMGLSDLDNLKEYFLTPDRLPLYPTKNSPNQFFASLDMSSYDKLLVYEDSKYNLHRLGEYFGRHSKGIHITPDYPLVNALLENNGLLDPDYKFDQVMYLKSKNVVDRASINTECYNKVIDEINSRPEQTIRIVDVGAGLLSILDVFLHGDEQAGFHALAKGKQIQYTAYESNQALWNTCQKLLESWGFALQEQLSDDEFVYESRNVELRFLLRDFDNDSSRQNGNEYPPDLVVGCCFADLIQPDQLVPSLIRTFKLLEHKNSDTLLYFPITFAGVTQFLPPKPFEEAKIPSDTVAFGLYSKALIDNLGHNLDPNLLQEVMRDYGIVLEAKVPSNWKIDSESHSYLFDTMLYFFGTAGGPLILENGWDAIGWIGRARKAKPNIQVSNMDLLFRIPANPRDKRKKSKCNSEETVMSTLKEIQFTGPKQVTTIEKKIPKLGPNQILSESFHNSYAPMSFAVVRSFSHVFTLHPYTVKASHSLISSGTELKIFNGLFDDAPLDVTIEDMKDERMAYPLAYGYCLVGHIIECGSAVPKDNIGKLVFSFSAHSSHVVNDIDSVQFVPEGIAPEDAIFMPSVETALSIVHDANVRIGENIAVYGQGLIGLLVTAILRIRKQLSLSKNFGIISTFDIIPDRLAASANLGASQALFPGGSQGPFDVSIEVSGNARALQSAIDHTSNGGRVIVASWYGNKDVSLKLGIDFHRSHKTIRTSQVSEISADLLGTWNKNRRFNLTWELVKMIHPSKLVLTNTATLDNASEIYKALNEGREISVGFVYP